MVYGNTKGIKQTVLARLDALIGAYDKNLLIDRTVLSTIAEITEKIKIARGFGRSYHRGQGFS